MEGIDRLLHTVLRPDFLSQQACPLHHLGVGCGSWDCLGEPLDRRWALDTNVRGLPLLQEEEPEHQPDEYSHQEKCCQDESDHVHTRTVARKRPGGFGGGTRKAAEPWRGVPTRHKQALNSKVEVWGFFLGTTVR